MKPMITAALVVSGIAAIGASYLADGGLWFLGGLALLALGGIISRFGGPADWWPGMTGKEF